MIDENHPDYQKAIGVTHEFTDPVTGEKVFLTPQGFVEGVWVVHCSNDRIVPPKPKTLKEVLRPE
jgi:hypothetical protein